MTASKFFTKKAFRFLLAIFLISIAWIAYVLFEDYQNWLTATPQDTPMEIRIRNGILLIVGLAALAYGAVISISHLNGTAGAGNKVPDSAAPSASAANQSFEDKMLSLVGPQYVLEVRGLGSFVGNHGNSEIWMKFDQVGNSHQSIISKNPQDYPWDSSSRFDNLRIAIAIAFRDAAGKTVERWPIPVISWGPPKHELCDFRAAYEIAAARQAASLGIHLLLWEEDANVEDGTELIQRLFAFFDKNPDAPGIIVLSTDGDIARFGNGEPGSGSMKNGYYAPDMPDSVTAMWVTRTDRVNQLIRPFAVKQPEGVNKNHAQYDIIKLWNFFWEKNDNRGPENFNAYYLEHYRRPGSTTTLTPGFMTSAWWHQQLPTLWKQITNAGPGLFKPSPYLPIRWTDWQLKQFDSAPVVGYLHRPIDIKLTDEQGKPLDRLIRRERLQQGWQQAMATLPDGERPKRIFYDSTLGGTKWVGHLNQAFQQIDPAAPDMTEDKEGFDLGVRIGSMGVSGPGMQLALGIIAGYHFGGPSATVHLRPNGDAMMMMVSPMGEKTKAAWVQTYGRMDPFGSEYPPDKSASPQNPDTPQETR
ncbi:DUF2875 family protein [Herbaspirillum sp. VT-16-41]|uniref:type VI lipase adapter Tla3 domain-containing protein n=1 Tax=Herbaspirillum sp. VT-16-41 TaxID=1953765 RepID=UPI0009816974|nr:DUF2875 family protein [Herbaspirillum sp. VT-16-41]ONN67620.1 hypothetical protein BTM36_05640 [Herbaspirillum sp. VT-16-41]